MRDHPGHAGSGAQRAARAIVPIENSVEGAVNATLDELATGTDIAISAELLLRWRSLCWPGRARRAATSRPSAATPRRSRSAGDGWREPADAEWLPASSNAEAARQAAEGESTPRWPGRSQRAVRPGGLVPEGSRPRPTRSLGSWWSAPPGPVPAATGADRTSLVAFLREDHPGALMELLTEFAVRGINLTRIESRPPATGSASTASPSTARVTWTTPGSARR